MDTQGILEQFDKDTADHVMRITHDDGAAEMDKYLDWAREAKSGDPE